MCKFFLNIIFHLVLRSNSDNFFESTLRLNLNNIPFQTNKFYVSDVRVKSVFIFVWDARRAFWLRQVSETLDVKR